MFAPPIALDRETKTYPCCEECQQRLARRWRLISAAVVIACLAVAAGAALIPWVDVAAARYTIAVVVALPVASIAAIAVPNVAGQPLKRRSIDWARVWVLIHSDRPKYMQLLEARYSNPANYTFRNLGIEFDYETGRAAPQFVADRVE
jgi:hypothetical protein